MKLLSVRFLLIVLPCFQILLSCDNLSRSPEIIPCPPDIARRALEYAIQYSNADTEYEFGGQDLLRSIMIDCSGLVVNCYKYAVTGTNYNLPFDDSAVINFYKEWSVSTLNPRPGDLIFMGEDKNNPSHMSLFVKRENGNIYFIDSTLRPGVNGVSERYYDENDGRFLSFGNLLIKQR